MSNIVRGVHVSFTLILHCAVYQKEQMIAQNKAKGTALYQWVTFSKREDMQKKIFDESGKLILKIPVYFPGNINKPPHEILVFCL